MKLREVAGEALCQLVVKAIPHSDQKPEDLLFAAQVFVAAHHVQPGRLSIEVGSRSGGSAYLFLLLIQALYEGPLYPTLFTVDPYGRKPYAEYGQEATMLYGDDHYVAMKKLLAPFANHAHFLLDSREFFARLGGARFWRDLGRRDEKYWTAEGVVGDPSFVFLDGDHSMEGIAADLTAIFGEKALQGTPHGETAWRNPAGGPAVLIDNVVHKDPRVLPMLERDWDMTLSPSKIQAVVRGRKKAT
jgi:hypothetical protein